MVKFKDNKDQQYKIFILVGFHGEIENNER